MTHCYSLLPTVCSTPSSTSSSQMNCLRMATLVLRSVLPPKEPRSLFVLHALRTYSARRVDASESLQQVCFPSLPVFIFSVVTKRFGFREGSIELYAERVLFRGLSAIAQAESLKFKLLHGLAVRRFGFICGCSCNFLSGLAMEFFVLLWKTRPRVVRSSYLVN